VLKLVLLSAAISLAAAIGFFVGTRKSVPINSNSEQRQSRRILYYVDPMHPAYRSDKPGTAPDCGMELEPVYSDPLNDSNATGDHGAGAVQVSESKQRIIGLRTETVTEGSGDTKIRTLGKVVPEDSRLFVINAPIDGWIQHTTELATGSLVRKDEVLATFYSPEFMAAEQAFISSQERFGVPGTESTYTIAKQNGIADRLRNLGMSDLQLKKLAQTKQVTDQIEVLSPADGIVLDRKVSAGQRFEKGNEFFRIADLSRVWIVAEVFENDFHAFRPGQIAQVTIPPGTRPVSARVTNQIPEFDISSRTHRIRLQVDNQGLALRPGLIVNVEMPVTLGRKLMVPSDAVLDFGLKKRVFVERETGVFEPREVETGTRTGERVQILKGLAAGDRVVVSGAFFLDSESRLKGTHKAVAPDVTGREARYLASVR
jgi:Cu(I)/Ag(I) efflux system membrane fusion protein